MDHLAQHIESLIFVAEKPISLEDIKDSLDNAYEVDIKEDLLQETIQNLRAKYDSEDFAMHLVEISNGFQFLTKPSYHNTIGNFLKLHTKKRLSRAALETLAIISYKQPVSKSDMEKVRGVSCEYAVQKLLEKELVEIVGRSPGPGRPLLYGTSEKFLEYFGIKSIADLPKLKEIQSTENSIGEAAPITEEMSPVESLVEGVVEEVNGVPEEVNQVEQEIEAPSEEQSIVIHEENELPSSSISVQDESGEMKLVHQEIQIQSEEE